MAKKIKMPIEEAEASIGIILVLINQNKIQEAKAYIPAVIKMHELLPVSVEFKNGSLRMLREKMNKL